MQAWRVFVAGLVIGSISTTAWSQTADQEKQGLFRGRVDSAFVIYEQSLTLDGGGSGTHTPASKDTKEMQASGQATGAPKGVKFKIISINVNHVPSVGVFQNIDPLDLSPDAKAGTHWYWVPLNKQKPPTQNYSTAESAAKLQPALLDISDLSSDSVKRGQLKNNSLMSEASPIEQEVINGVLDLLQKALQKAMDDTHNSNGVIPPPEQDTAASTTPNVTSPDPNSVAACQACATPVDLTGRPFTTAKNSPFFAADASGKTICIGKGQQSYEMPARWVLAYYTANNVTKAAQSGDDVIGVGLLHTRKRKDPATGAYWIQFTTLYGTEAKANAFTITHTYGIADLKKDFKPQADTAQVWNFVTSFFAPLEGTPPAATSKSDSSETETAKAGGGAAGAATDPEVAAPGGDGSSASISTGSKTPSWLGYKMPPSIEFPPQVSMDSTGTDVASKLTLTPVNDKGALPTVEIDGSKYLERSLYDASIAPSWKVSDDLSFGGIAEKKLQQAGQAINDTASVQQSLKYTCANVDNSGLAFTCDESAGASQKSNDANGPTAVKTDEYSGSVHCTEEKFEYFSVFDPKNDNTLAKDIQRPTDADVQLDFDQWIKPSASTQDEHSYTAAAGQVHCGADIPTPEPTGWDDAAEYFRVDANVLGGGVMGVTPATDLFYGGNPNATGTTADDIPGPVLRSFGTGKLDVYSARPMKGSDTTGASSFGSANLTVALPFPGLAFSFLDPQEAALLNNLIGSPDGKYSIANTEAQRNDIEYVANYEDKFAFRPLFTCDAVWLGAPDKYVDRTLVSLGGGGEFSVGVINFDVLYEATIRDTGHQTLGENIIMQMSYDIHF